MRPGLIDGRYDHSSWVGPEALRRCNAIELDLRASAAAAPLGTSFQGWPGESSAVPPTLLHVQFKSLLSG